MRETAIQTAIINYLSYLENLGVVYVIRNNSFSGHIIRRDSSRGWINNSKPGTPDIVICILGRFIGLEVKNEKGVQSANQRSAQERIEKAGGCYYIVRSVEEVEDIINRIRKDR